MLGEINYISNNLKLKVNMQGGSTGASRTSRSSEKITKSKSRKTKEIDDKVVTLRAALFNPNGKDKDVTEGIAPAFLEFSRNNLNLKINFTAKLTNDQLDYVFEMAKDNMEERYDASGYGWDDEDKERELTEDGTRFLLIRDMNKDADDENDRIIGFVHFRFSVQGDILDVMAGDTCLFIWDIHLEEEYQRKGVGKHLVMLLELIARREQMAQILIPVQLQDETTSAWVQNGLKNFVSQGDALQALLSFDADAEGFQVYGKSLIPPVKRTTPAAAPTAAPVIFNFNNQAEVKAKQAEAQQQQSVDTLNKSVSELNLSSSSADAAATTGTATSVSTSADDSVVQNNSIETEATEATEEADANEGEIDLSTLNEYDVIHGLKVLYFEKNGCQPKDSEVDQWMATLRAQRGENEGDVEA